VELRQVSLLDPLVAPLLADLEREYLERYGSNNEMKRTHPDEFEPPEGVFLVLMDGTVTAAGGGFRRRGEGVCEVKRMWTHSAYRRRGLATLILDALEDAATVVGYRRLVLETGPKQPEAAALYERRGYSRIPHFGQYPQALAFEADLSDH
jgi:GNAT superfamily N-acetyltransferase